MSNLPLAELTARHALRHDGGLILYVAGFTPGFGGRLVVELDSKIFPPAFRVLAEPGITGITGQAPPDRVPTENAYSFSFPQDVDTVHLRDAEGVHELGLVQVEGRFGGEEGDPSGGEPSRGGVSDCEWSAVQDFMPPGAPTLRVRGLCTMPTPGYRLSLTRTVPQGINPAILLLDLRVEPPTGFVTQVLTPTPVEYEEEGEQRFTEVQIQPEGTRIPVKPVH